VTFCVMLFTSLKYFVLVKRSQREPNLGSFNRQGTLFIENRTFGVKFMLNSFVVVFSRGRYSNV